MKKYLPIIILLLIAFTADFFRDYIFVNLNYQIHYLKYLDYNFTDSFIEKLVNGLSINSINQLKWGFSLLFICFYTGLTVILIHFYYKKHKKKYYFFTLLFLLSFLFFSCLSYLISILILDISNEFP